MAVQHCTQLIEQLGVACVTAVHSALDAGGNDELDTISAAACASTQRADVKVGAQAVLLKHILELREALYGVLAVKHFGVGT